MRQCPQRLELCHPGNEHQVLSRNQPTISDSSIQDIANLNKEVCRLEHQSQKQPLQEIIELHSTKGKER